MGFSRAYDVDKKEEWIQAFKNVKYKKVLFYNGEEDLPGIFKQANGRFIWKQTRNKFVDDFSYNDYLRADYMCDMDLMKMLIDGEGYSRY